MAIKPVLKMGEPVLLEVAKPVDQFDTPELHALIQQRPAARVDYIQFFDPHTFAAARLVTQGTHLALAVFVGKTRLIDNARL